MRLEDNVSSWHGKFLNTAASLALAALIAVIPASSGCKRAPYGSPGISQELQDMWPIWNYKDLEINQQGGGAAVEYTHEINLKPEFYRGRIPVKFKAQYPITGMMGGIGGMKTCLAHKFSDFSNYFVYDAVWLKGAVSVDNSNSMVAEAKFNYVEREGQMMGLQMEEFHYDDGLLVFHCISEVDSSTGFKTKETNKSGRKQRDYFFIAPVGLSE